jgi:hypothetical protein
MSWLESRGYLPGGGLVSPDRSTFLLMIPKNASTYLTNVLTTHGWMLHILNDQDQFEKVTAFIRDPVDRWISGFSTYAALYHCGKNYGSDHWISEYNELSQRIIFDQIYFDDHTVPQTFYTKQIESKNPIFLKYNKNLLKQINDFLETDLHDIEVDSNVTENNYDTKQISKFMRDRISSDPILMNKLVKSFKDDYDFINDAKFYDKPRP